MNISIIGLGLIGGSIAKAIRKSGGDFHISAFDRSDVLSAALAEKTIDSALGSVEDSLTTEIVFLCLPLQESLEAFDRLTPGLTENVILTDVCGVKRVFEEKWQNARSRGIYIGGHPMTGKEKGGYENSDPLLFENAIYILTGTDGNPAGKEKLTSVINLLGARIAYLEPGTHDRIVSAVSHIPQLLSVALVNGTARCCSDADPLRFAAGGFRDMTRIASSSFNIWKDVIRYNKSEILRALDVIEDEILSIRNNVEEEMSNEMEAMFKSASERRDTIPKSNKGFLSPLYDIFVYVKDQPGIISSISTALFRENINIKDIELLKIREGMGGTFRLSFESEDDMQKARRILDREGFSTAD